MFDWLGDGIKKAFNWLFGWIGTVWNSVTAWVTALWGFITGAVSWIYDALTTWFASIASSLNEAKDAIEGVSASTFENIATHVSYLNVWLPISESVALLVVYFLVGKAMLLYRFIKSWIPTVS